MVGQSPMSSRGSLSRSGMNFISLCISRSTRSISLDLLLNLSNARYPNLPTAPCNTELDLSSPFKHDAQRSLLSLNVMLHAPLLLYTDTLCVQRG